MNEYDAEIVKWPCQTCGRPVYVTRLQVRLYKGDNLLRELRCAVCIELERRAS